MSILASSIKSTNHRTKLSNPSCLFQSHFAYVDFLILQNETFVKKFFRGMVRKLFTVDHYIYVLYFPFVNKIFWISAIQTLLPIAAT